MKILLIGDPHLRITDFNQSIAFLKWVEDVAKQYRPDVICNLGDTFHDHAVLRSELLKEFKDHIERTELYRTQYWYILGNHDQYKPSDSKYHALQSFEQTNGLIIFDQQTDYNDQITIVPYVAKFEDFPTKTNKICITHNTFIGADYGFKREDCGIDADKISAEIIISGHIHKRQAFGKVVYPGTPYAHSMNDIDEIKGLILFDTETYQQEFVPSPFPTWKSIPFNILNNNDVTSLHNLLTSKIDKLNKWVLNLSGSKSEISTYLKSKQYLSLVEDKNIIVKTNFTDSNKLSNIKIESNSVQDVVSEYVNKIYSGSLDKELVIKAANSILDSIR